MTRSAGQGRRRGSPAGKVGELLELLPDLVERARLRGMPIVVDDPGTEHGRRLLETLGITVRKPEK